MHHAWMQDVTGGHGLSRDSLVQTRMRQRFACDAAYNALSMWGGSCQCDRAIVLESTASTCSVPCVAGWSTSFLLSLLFSLSSPSSLPPTSCRVLLQNGWRKWIWAPLDENRGFSCRMRRNMQVGLFYSMMDPDWHDSFFSIVCSWLWMWLWLWMYRMVRRFESVWFLVMVLDPRYPSLCKVFFPWPMCPSSGRLSMWRLSRVQTARRRFQRKPWLLSSVLKWDSRGHWWHRSAQAMFHWICCFESKENKRLVHM